MDIFKKIINNWKLMSTSEKIAIALDVVCGAGTSIMGMKASKHYCEGCSKIAKVCVNTTILGIGIAAGDIASKALYDSYGRRIGEKLDAAKKQVAEKEKEAAANE